MSAIVEDIRKLFATIKTAPISAEIITMLEKKVLLLTDESLLLISENARLKTENADLRAQLDNAKPIGFVEHMGIFWKRGADGFEKFGYCKLCSTHPVMAPRTHIGLWVCPEGHTFPLSIRAPLV